MTDSKTTMSQDNFSSNLVRGSEAGDFSTDEGALAWAEGQLDKLVDAMRYQLKRHIAGWPEGRPVW